MTQFSFETYQEGARTTAIYPGRGTPEGLLYATQGLAGEIGEVLGKLKKSLRGDYKLMDRREPLLAELGDVLWYISACCDEAGTELVYLGAGNVDGFEDSVRELIESIEVPEGWRRTLNSLLHTTSILLLADLGMLATCTLTLAQVREERPAAADLVKNVLRSVLVHVGAMVYLLDSDISEVGQANLDKLNARKESGTLKGDGDNR